MGGGIFTYGRLFICICFTERAAASWSEYCASCLHISFLKTSVAVLCSLHGPVLRIIKTEVFAFPFTFSAPFFILVKSYTLTSSLVLKSRTQRKRDHAIYRNKYNFSNMLQKAGKACHPLPAHILAKAPILIRSKGSPSLNENFSPLAFALGIKPHLS